MYSEYADARFNIFNIFWNIPKIRLSLQITIIGIFEVPTYFSAIADK